MHSPASSSKLIEPTSYTQIYNHIEQTLDECSTFINNAEIDYYQGSSVSFTETSRNQIINRPLSVIVLQAWSHRLDELRKERFSHDIRNKVTVDELLRQAITNTSYQSITDESIVLLERISSKTNEQFYSKIPILINKIFNCMNLMEQYFLSFYDIENIQYIVQNKKQEVLHDEYLETVYSYEKSRWLHMFQVNKSLKILREMPQRIQDGEGVAFSTLSKESQELALRCNCTSFPYILALPECYNEARRAVNSLRTWLSQDKNYTEFTQKSLQLLNKNYLQAEKAFEISKCQLSQIKYRVESHRVRLNKLEQENEINERKYQEFETRFNLKEREYSSKYSTHEVCIRHLRNLLKQSDDIKTHVDNSLLIKKFQKDIKQFSEELPKLKSHVDTVQARIHCFQQRKQKLTEMHNENKRMDQEVQLALEDKIRKENQFNRVVKCRDILRNIYKCRKRNNLIQKIFYDLPVITKHNGKNEDDDLSKTLCIISKSIGRDWNRLYCQLPFHPKRGEEALSDDLKHINGKYHRGDVFQDQAMDALNKWRRLHTHAKIDDLIYGLQQIRRFDIVQLIKQHIIKPKRVLDIDEEEIDLKKQEIEDLNEKLNQLFEKIRENTIISQETDIHSTKNSIH